MAWEFDLLYWFQGLHGPVLDKIEVATTMLAEKGIFWIVIALGILFLCKDKKKGLIVCGALFFSVVFCNLLLKNIVMRDRPSWLDTSVKLLVENPDDYSFPSGHTSFSFAAATGIFQCHKGWGIAALCVAALIGISRLYLFVHFPTDVFTGMLCGIFSGLLSGVVVTKWYERYPDFRVPILERRKA